MAEVPLLPHDALWSTSATGQARVSPDGRSIAFVQAEAGVADVVVMPAAGGERARLTDFGSGHGCELFAWAADSVHLLVVHDDGGNENYQVAAVNVNDGGTRPLVDEPDVRAVILGTDPGQPSVVAMALNLRDPAWHDVYLVDVTTGERTLIAENPGFTRWVLDQSLVPRAGVRPREDGGAELQVADSAGGWRSVLEVAPADAFGLLFDLFAASVDADGSTLHVCTSHEADTIGLLRIDVATGAHRYVAQHPSADLLYVHFHGGEPLLAGFPGARLEQQAVDASVHADIELLSSALTGDWSVVSSDTAGTCWTVQEVHDDASTRYHRYDRRSGRVELLFSADPALDALPLARMEPFSFAARDGIEIPGYLTFPPGRTREELPTVVMIHGGPANRYFWGYHPQVQFLANRGYLVAQVNYRGSLGYGKRFMAAGDGQWARAMHTDIVDAINHLTVRGVADRERIGLWGTSYGGYECLVAVTHDPSLVRCAVPIVAPANLVTLLQSIPAYWRAERAYFTRVLGDDEKTLWDRSPLRLVDRITAPLLLFYGEQDPRVTADEAHQLEAALTAAGVPHEMHILPGEGHNLGLQMTPENRALYIDRLDAFLAEHLGTRADALSR